MCIFIGTTIFLSLQKSINVQHHGVEKVCQKPEMNNLKKVYKLYGASSFCKKNKAEIQYALNFWPFQSRLSILWLCDSVLI